MRDLKVYLITGEPSGDLLGSRLMRAIKSKTGDKVRFFGVGGETMEQEGLKSLFDISDLAVMGILEVIPSIPKILRHMDEIEADIAVQKPDIIITIDSYSFSARIHKRLKKSGCTIPHVHYVAPQVWAWKAGRAKKIAEFVDHLFCLLPNEPAYFTPYGMAATFVGHPVVEGGAAKGNGQSFRKKHLISQKTLVVCMLPGSRKNEINFLMPIFKEAVEKLADKYPDIYVVVPTVRTVSARVKAGLKGWGISSIALEGEADRYDAFAASDVAVAASGTVSLELAMANVPHVIAYKLSRLSAMIVRRLLKIKYANLINILTDKPIIPELLQENCTSDKIAAKMEELLKHKNPLMSRGLAALGCGGSVTPSEKMAMAVIELAGKGRGKK